MTNNKRGKPSPTPETFGLGLPFLAGSPPQPPLFPLSCGSASAALTARMNAMLSLQARGLRDIADAAVPHRFPLYRIQTGSKGALGCGFTDSQAQGSWDITTSGNLIY